MDMEIHRCLKAATLCDDGMKRKCKCMNRKKSGLWSSHRLWWPWSAAAVWWVCVGWEGWPKSLKFGGARDATKTSVTHSLCTNRKLRRRVAKQTDSKVGEDTECHPIPSKGGRGQPVVMKGRMCVRVGGIWIGKGVRSSKTRETRREGLEKSVKESQLSSLLTRHISGI